MPTPSSNNILWRWPAFILWLVLFSMGFIPEYTFLFAREMGLVVTQRALINSEYAITLALSGYVAFFTHQRCIEAGRGPLVSRANALQLFCVALMAFLPVFALYPGGIVISATLAKWLAWLYLYIIIIRYYFFDGQGVFRKMRPLLPSARAEEAVAAAQLAAVEIPENPENPENHPDTGADTPENANQPL